ncbi:unnamed protein product, partial [Laminaria digitata]
SAKPAKWSTFRKARCTCVVVFKWRKNENRMPWSVFRSFTENVGRFRSFFYCCELWAVSVGFVCGLGVSMLSIHNGVSIQICRCYWCRGQGEKNRPKFFLATE